MRRHRPTAMLGWRFGCSPDGVGLLCWIKSPPPFVEPGLSGQDGLG